MEYQAHGAFIITDKLSWNGLQLDVIFHVAGGGFVPLPGHAKDHHKNGTKCHLVWHACVRVGVWQYSLTVYQAG